MKAPPRLQEIRERQMLSQYELERKTGVAAETISRLERGESSAWPRTVRKLAEGLGVSYEDLYEESEAAPLAKAPATTR